MVAITINFSQAGITGVFQARPRNTFKAVNSNNIIVQQTYTANIASSTAVLDVPQSSHVGVTYEFSAYSNSNVDDFYLQDGTLYASTDPDLGLTLRPRYQWTTGTGFNNEWYSGKQLGTAAPTADNKLLSRITRVKQTQLIQPFDSLVGASAANVADLIDLGITTEQLQYSALQVATLLTQAPFISLLPKGITYRGQYNAATTYIKDNAVGYDGSLWVYISASNLSGITPGTDPLVWDKGVSKGDAGGTGAQSIGYNHTNFTAMTADAASRSDLRGGVAYAIANSAAPDLTNYARKDVANNFTGINRFLSPSATPDAQEVVTVSWADGRYGRKSATNTWSATQTFTGGAIVQDRNLGDNSQNAANTKYVQTELGVFVPSRGASPIADVNRNTAQTIGISAGAGNNGDVIIWNNFPLGGFFNTAGDFNVPAGIPTDTQFLFQGVLTFNVSCNFSSSGDRRVAMRVHGTVGAVDIGNAYMLTIPSFNGTATFTFPFSRIFKLSANQSFQIRLHVFDTFGATVTAVALTASGANNFVNVFRHS